MEVLDRLVTHGSRGDAALLAGDLNLREDEASKPKAASAVGYVMNFNVSFFFLCVALCRETEQQLSQSSPPGYHVISQLFLLSGVELRFKQPFDLLLHPQC
jgi:hypothetical protein